MNKRMLIKLGFFSASIPIIGYFWQKNKSASTIGYDHQAIFAAYADTIVPADDFPGAVDLAVDKEIFATITAYDGAKNQLFTSLEDLNTLAVNSLRQSFIELDLSSRTKILQSVFDKTASIDKQSVSMLNSLRSRVLFNFYQQPEAYQMLNYQPPKNGYPDYNKPLVL